MKLRVPSVAMASLSAIVLTAACEPQPIPLGPPPPVAEGEPDPAPRLGGDKDVRGGEQLVRQVGTDRSIHPPESKFWAVADAAKHDEHFDTAYPAVWLPRTDPRHQIEAVVAAALGAARQKPTYVMPLLRLPECRDSGCGALLMDDTWSTDVAAVRREVLVKPGRDTSRTEVVGRCRSQAPRVLSTMAEWIRAGDGLFVGVWAIEGFEAPRSKGTRDARLFPVVGVSEDALAIRDVSDYAPIVYRIGLDTLCDALVLGGGQPWRSNERVSWAHLPAWRVTDPNAAPPAPPPRPPPVPLPTPPVPRPQDPDRVASFVSQPCPSSHGACDFGTYQLGEAPYERSYNAPLAWAARPGTVGIALRRSAVGSVSAWQRETDRRLGVAPRSIGFSWRVVPGESDFWSYYYHTASRSEAAALRPLATLLADHIATSADSDPITSIIGFVQGIPYRKIPKTESATGLRSSVVALRENAGDCDTVSLMAATLLAAIGHDVVVATGTVPAGSGDRGNHAVLGVAMASPPGASFITHNGRRYVAVEMTGPTAIGDLSVWGFGPGTDLRAHGWAAHPIPGD